jgi:uroporphyrinogen III methyltransferase/synthase
MTVYLVGAGPGDPGLLTVRASELIAAADVIIYDRLIPATALDGARPEAQLIYAGKEGGGPSVDQAEIERLLLEHGAGEQTVVRLKGGDPFVFGRGGEEVAALAAAGVPYEVVPGVSTLTAIPGLAGIPLTSRGDSAQLTVVSGTRADGGELDYAHLAATPGTLVVFMGLARLPAIADGLVRAGRDPAEPAAVLSRLSWPDAEVRTGTLATIVDAARGLESPAVAIVGHVVAHAFRVALVA